MRAIAQREQARQRRQALAAATSLYGSPYSPHEIAAKLRAERAALVKRIAEIDAVLKKMEETP